MSDARGAHGTLRNGRLRCVLAALHILNLVTVGECQSQSCPWLTYYQAGQGCTGTCPPGSIFVDGDPVCTFALGNMNGVLADFKIGHTISDTLCAQEVLGHANIASGTGATWATNLPGHLDGNGKQSYACFMELSPEGSIDTSYYPLGQYSCAFQVPTSVPCQICGAGTYESGRSACVNCPRCVGAADARLLRQKPSSSLRAPR
jgi:hypothetical protein